MRLSTRPLPNKDVLRLLRFKTLMRLVLEEGPIDVRTWCYFCGLSAVVSLPNHYDLACRFLCIADDMPMSHYGHFEDGNWGMYLRFDEILQTAFPQQHKGIEKILFDEYNPYVYTFPAEPVPPVEIADPSKIHDSFVLDFFYDSMRYL